MSSSVISRLQWHPFTTIPGEQPHSMVSIIKQYGKWTGKLMDRCQCCFLHQTSLIITHLALWWPVTLDGETGFPCVYYFDHLNKKLQGSSCLKVSVRADRKTGDMKARLLGAG